MAEVEAVRSENVGREPKGFRIEELDPLSKAGWHVQGWHGRRWYRRHVAPAGVARRGEKPSCPSL